MEETNGFRQPGDIGGPMAIGSGYRWNVPVVTYGFDKSFLDFFGTNGVAAVESAIQVLNNLPPASDMVLTNYPLDTEQFNSQAQAQNLYDLKSATLVVLLEQMGLIEPSRYVFSIRQWNPILLTYLTESSSWWTDGIIPNYIVMRNFDPETLTPSSYVNEALYGCYIGYGFATYNGTINDALEIPADPLVTSATAVADASLSFLEIGDGVFNPGESFTGLTEDDVGGL